MTENTESRPLRWGVLGAAGIVRRNWPAMQESGAARLVALAGRDVAKAGRFVDEMQAEHPWPEKPVVFESYEALLASKNVDAVYIPLPTAIRKPWVIRAAEAGKHVLCEKPCAVSADDLREMTDACRDNGVLFMDGVMFMHDPRFARLREALDAGEIGSVKRITSAFSFLRKDDFVERDIRANPELEPAGCLGDLGWYCLRATLWAMNWRLPTRVSCRVLDAVEKGGASAIMEFSGELDFPGRVTSAFHCSFLLPHAKWLDIAGTAGTLRVADFINPADANDTAWEVGFRRIPKPSPPEPCPAVWMFRRFAEEAGKPVPDGHWAEISLKTQLVQDACLRSALEGRPVALDAAGNCR